MLLVVVSAETSVIEREIHFTDESTDITTKNIPLLHSLECRLFYVAVKSRVDQRAIKGKVAISGHKIK